MIVFFGPAGAGKSVQGQMLAARQNWEWFSMGQLLRDTNNAEILNIINQGKLVPTDLTNTVMAAALKQAADAKGVILDGYPRQLEQAKWLVETQPHDGHSLQAAVVLEVPLEESIKRLSLRGRPDDTPKAIEERLHTYQVETKPILDYLESRNIKVLRVDGTGTIDQIHERVVKELKACNLA